MKKVGSRNPMAGRHAVGARTANAGGMRGGGQSEPAGNKTITASRTTMNSVPPVKSAVNTSADAERWTNKPPTPFSNAQGGLKVPAPTHPAFRTPSNFAQLGRQHASPSKVMSDTAMYAAVGYTPQQACSGKGVNSINSGYPTRNVARLGGGNQPFAKARKRGF